MLVDSKPSRQRGVHVPPIGIHSPSVHAGSRAFAFTGATQPGSSVTLALTHTPAHLSAHKEALLPHAGD